MTSVGVVTPFWLDPPAEALDVAVAADEAGFGTLWIGEMATFDAFGLAVAVGMRTSAISLRVGPLAVGVAEVRRSLASLVRVPPPIGPWLAGVAVRRSPRPT